MVARLTCSNQGEVVWLGLRHPPLDDQVMLEERSREVACAWVSLVTRIENPPVGPASTGSFSLSTEACAVTVVRRNAAAAIVPVTSERIRAVLIRRKSFPG